MSATLYALQQRKIKQYLVKFGPNMDWSKPYYAIQIQPSGTFDSIEKSKEAPKGIVYAAQTQSDWINILTEHARLSKGLKKSVQKSVKQIRSDICTQL